MSNPNLTAFHIAEFAMSKKYDFQKNILDNTLLFKEKTAKEFKTINYDTVYCYLKKNKVKIHKDDMLSILNSNWVKTVDPIENYFANLKWDGIDYIDLLAKHVDTNDNHFFRVQFKKALVRSVACGLGKYINRTVLTFISKQQSIGKSTFIRNLSPFPSLYTEEPIENDRDTNLRYIGRLIFNIEELDTLNKRDVTSLKSVISKGTITLRTLFTNIDNTFVRRCNFFASSNRCDFLTDVYNTRWLCFNVNKIDYAYKKINIDQVWAQAYDLYTNQHPFELTEQEEKQRDEMNRYFSTPSTDQDFVTKYLQAGDPLKDEWMSNADIIEYLREESNKAYNPNGVLLGRALNDLGFRQHVKRIKGKQQRGYFVKKMSLYEYRHALKSPANIVNSDDPMVNVGSGILIPAGLVAAKEEEENTGQIANVSNETLTSQDVISNKKQNSTEAKQHAGNNDILKRYPPFGVDDLPPIE